MITSDRKFGVEIEFVCSTHRSLSNISNVINVIPDGSLRPHPHAGEYVSPILQGESGEFEIHRVCEVLKKNKADTANIQTSVHVHLDGKKRDSNIVSARTRNESVNKQYGISSRVIKEVGLDTVNRIVQGDYYSSDRDSFVISKLDNVTYLSKATITKHPRLNYTYFTYVKADRFKWLRNVLYFYTQFSPVMEDLVSNSRRFGNMYCIPLHKSYELDKIASVSNMDSLQTLWYKGDRSSRSYDDSRYHNVNLDSYFGRHGTVEIRSHGGTKDPDKILMWVKLHQYIVDKLENVELADIKAKTPDLHKEFLNFVDDEYLQEYIKRLVGYYSGKKIN